jgi:hypothetical protein
LNFSIAIFESDSKNGEVAMSEIKSKSVKSIIGYGVKPPIIGFPEVMTILREVYRKIGSSGSLDDLSRVLGNTLTSSSFILKIRALKSFGLIQMTDSKFTTTELTERIINPTTPREKPEAELESFLRIDVIKSIYENYRGKVLPEREFLSNFIQSNLKIPGSLKDKWADYFLEGASSVRILHRRGDGSNQVLSMPSSSPEPEEPISNQIPVPEQPLARTDQPGGMQTSLLSRIDSTEWGILNQRTVSGNRRAIFAIPDNLSHNDVKALKVIIKGIEATIDGLCKEQEDGSN